MVGGREGGREGGSEGVCAGLYVCCFGGGDCYLADRAGEGERDGLTEKRDSRPKCSIYIFLLSIHVC